MGKVRGGSTLENCGTGVVDTKGFPTARALSECGGSMPMPTEDATLPSMEPAATPFLIPPSIR